MARRRIRRTVSTCPTVCQYCCINGICKSEADCQTNTKVIIIIVGVLVLALLICAIISYLMYACKKKRQAALKERRVKDLNEGKTQQLESANSQPPNNSFSIDSSFAYMNQQQPQLLPMYPNQYNMVAYPQAQSYPSSYAFNTPVYINPPVNMASIPVGMSIAANGLPYGNATQYNQEFVRP